MEQSCSSSLTLLPNPQTYLPLKNDVLGPYSRREKTEAEDQSAGLVWEAKCVPYCKWENTIMT